MSKIVNLTNQLEDDVNKADIWANGPVGASYTSKDGVKVPSIRTLSEKAEINVLASEESARISQQSAAKAQDIVTSAQINNGMFADIGSGLLGTSNGDVFLVCTNAGIDAYKNEDGNAVFLTKDITSIEKIQYVSSNQQASDKVYENTYDNENIFEIIDNQGRQTWIQVDENGLPSDTSIKGIEQKIGIQHEKHADQKNLLFGITSLEGILTDIAIGNDGRFVQKTIDSIKLRMGGGIATLRKDVGFVGSSTMYLMHHFISSYFNDYSIALLGDSGARFDSISVRAGFPAHLKFLSDVIQIGYNEVETSWEIDKGMDKFGITLDNGIVGDLLYFDGGYVFDVKKEYKTIANEKIDFKTNIGLFDFVFINSGKNNLNGSDGIGKNIFDKTLELVKFYESKYIDYIVLDHFVNYGSSEAVKNNVLECNKLLQSRFGKKFMSIFNMIKSDEMWSFMGLSQTEEDIIALNNDEIPPSFQLNTSHLNDKASQYIAFKMFEKYKEIKNDTNY